MTKKQAVDYFLEVNRPFSDYWSMQLAWADFTDTLKTDDAITERQWQVWTNPCTPETFKTFNKRFKGGE